MRMRLRVADAGDRAELLTFPDDWMVSDPTRFTEWASRIGGEARRGRSDSTRVAFLHGDGNRERSLDGAAR